MFISLYKIYNPYTKFNPNWRIINLQGQASNICTNVVRSISKDTLQYLIQRLQLESR